MNVIHNEKIMKARNANKVLMIVGIILIIVSLVFFYFAFTRNSSDEKNVKYFNDYIEHDGDRVGARTYLDVKYLSESVVVYDDTTDAYYFASDGTYTYMVYLKRNYAEKILARKDLDKNPERIAGITKKIGSDVQKIAIDVYNQYFIEENDEKVTNYTFYKIFGDLYLDSTETFSTAVSGFLFGGIFFFGFGLILSIVGFVFVKRFNKNINNIPTDEFNRIENEMGSPDCEFYYGNKVVLTKSFLIMMDNKFAYYKYDDIIWIYRVEHKTNGIHTADAINLCLKDGKSYQICYSGIGSSKQRAQYDAVWNKLVGNNPNIIIGYTPDNIRKYKEIAHK